jgi:hypothetical protein
VRQFCITGEQGQEDFREKIFWQSRDIFRCDDVETGGDCVDEIRLTFVTTVRYTRTRCLELVKGLIHARAP